MRTLTTTLYSYSELPEASKAKLREKVQEEGRSQRYDYVFDQEVLPNGKAVLASLGYPTDQVVYSLGWVQGSGMAFYGALSREGLGICARRLLNRSHRNSLFLSKHPRYKTPLLDDVTLTLAKCPGTALYHHWNTMYAQVECACGPMDETERPGFFSALTVLMDAIEDEIRQVSRHLEAEGYEALEAEWAWDAARWDEEVLACYPDTEFFADGTPVEADWLEDD